MSIKSRAGKGKPALMLKGSKANSSSVSIDDENISKSFPLYDFNTCKVFF